MVEARIRGSEFPDDWVLLGNHRDAWAFGGVDPSSGTASMLELSRALGELKKNGMRPRRTLVICSWDGEANALTGSTEWGEQFGDELKKSWSLILMSIHPLQGRQTAPAMRYRIFMPTLLPRWRQ